MTHHMHTHTGLFPGLVGTLEPLGVQLPSQLIHFKKLRREKQQKQAETQTQAHKRKRASQNKLVASTHNRYVLCVCNTHAAEVKLVLCSISVDFLSLSLSRIQRFSPVFDSVSIKEKEKNGLIFFTTGKTCHIMCALLNLKYFHPSHLIVKLFAPCAVQKHARSG